MPILFLIILLQLTGRFFSHARDRPGLFLFYCSSTSVLLLIYHCLSTNLLIPLLLFTAFIYTVNRMFLPSDICSIELRALRNITDTPSAASQLRCSATSAFPPPSLLLSIYNRQDDHLSPYLWESPCPFWSNPPKGASPLVDLLARLFLEIPPRSRWIRSFGLLL